MQEKNRIAVVIVGVLWLILFPLGLGRGSIERLYYYLFVELPAGISFGVIPPISVVDDLFYHADYGFLEPSSAYWFALWGVFVTALLWFARWRPNLSYRWPRYFWLTIAYSLMPLSMRAMLIERIESPAFIFVHLGVFFVCSLIALMLSRPRDVRTMTSGQGALAKSG